MIDYSTELAKLQHIGKGNIGEYLGIEFTELGENYICGRMPIDHRTVQPAGILHGGISLVLAETLGTIGAMVSVTGENKVCVGLDINGNHIRSVAKGYIHGKASCRHKGKTTQVWEVDIRDDNDNLVCISRITMAILDAKK
jgi:1,4-dihydroxy-2-naphthoyl-CoA hydrolase